MTRDDYIKNWRLNNPEYLKEYNKKYYVNNKKKCGDYTKKYKQTQFGKYSSYKCGAKTRSLDFTLSFNDFCNFWQKNCYYCGDKIKTVGLDRIDSKLGYIKNNIVSCCKWCNRMKMEHSIKDFFNKCEQIIENKIKLFKE